MTARTIPDLARSMGKIDFAMLTTRTDGDQLATRPMGNNGEVDWDGNSFYFSYDSARIVADIERDPHVALSFQGSASLLGMPPMFVAVEGEASIIRDKAAFAEHWTGSLKRWFPEGTDTEGLALVHVRATRVHYWDGAGEGEAVV